MADFGLKAPTSSQKKVWPPGFFGLPCPPTEGSIFPLHLIKVPPRSAAYNAVFDKAILTKLGKTQMTQNLISLNVSDADYAEVDAALDTIETKLAGLINLPNDLRRGLNKMGDKSEAFCRQTLVVLAQNPQVVPPGLDLAEAQRDLVALDALRSRTTRIRLLLGRAEDSEMALGSDVMTASLHGYAMLKVLGKGSGLDALRRSMAARFSRSTSTHKGATVSEPAA